MAMIAAVEFDNFVATSKSARKSNARHGRFGAAVDHSHFLNRRHPLADQFRQFDFERIWHSETETARGHSAHRIDDYFWSVTENRGAPTSDVVDAFISIDIPNFRAGCTLNKKRLAADAAKCAHWRINASRNAFSSSGEEFKRTASHAPKIIINSSNR